MVRLVKYNKCHFEILDSYKLNKTQSDFTATIGYCINERKDTEDVLKTLVTVLYKDLPVGFFVLDRGEDKFNITSNPNAILVRSFSINPDYQGKGIGTKSMELVVDFTKKHIPNVNEIVLSVNFKNNNAYHVYLNSGYVDNNQTIMGRMGAQHVLSKRI